MRKHFNSCTAAMVCFAVVSYQQCWGQTKKALADKISYTHDIRPIVKNFCTTCHAGDAPEGEFVLTSYEDVRMHVEKGTLLKRINDAKKPMPQNGLLPKYMRRMFQLWADMGYINQGQKPSSDDVNYAKFTPPKITPIDVDQQGFGLLEKMQGHWVGSMNLMGQEYDWMAFDYRAISPSHVHGIFEGGTIGNLFTSFFVAKFKGKRTIMARNGGILNGIYRTSYFVLDQAEERRGRSYYRLVDAYGGKDIMWMELTFTGDKVLFNSYTSRFGLATPKRHMSFRAKRTQPELAEAAAKAVGFPQKNVIDFDLSQGLPEPDWGKGVPLTSASYIWEDATKNLVELGKIARDPIRIDQIPYLSKFTISVERNKSIQGKKLHMYLSSRALTDEKGKFITRGGYVRLDLLNTLLSFPEISAKQNEFTFTYLHPGHYYLTVIADVDSDGYPSPGDITHPRKRITISPCSHSRLVIKNLDVKN